MSLNHPRRFRLERSGPWIGVAGLFVLLWVSISTVLYAPWWGVLLALALLVPQAIIMSRWARTDPIRCIWLPVVGLAVWFALVLIGVEWWGWKV